MIANVSIIQDRGQHIKGWLDRGLVEWGSYAVVILACLIAFGLGRLSVLESQTEQVSIQQAALSHPEQLKAGGLVVSSRGGNSYFYPWCPGAAKILSENQRWFLSEKEAQEAGYRPAKNCKGLGEVDSQ
jgi:hypothetical protein